VSFYKKAADFDT